MSETNARTPGIPIKAPDAAHRLEAWLGRADEPRLELVGPGKYNELLQDAQRSWAIVEKSVKEPGARASENQEVETRLQELARDRYFLTLTESNIVALLALLSQASADGVGGLVASSGVRAACRVLAAWVRRTSVQPGPSWASKQVSAIVSAACPALTSAASEAAAGSVIYLLGSAAAAPQCVPADRSRCQDVIIRSLQLRRSAVTGTAQFSDALAGAAYLITGGPGVHGPPLAALLTSLLNLWSAPSESPSSSAPSDSYNSSLPRQKGASNGFGLQPQTPSTDFNSPGFMPPSVGLPTQQPRNHSDFLNPSIGLQPLKPQPPLGQALALSRLLEYVGAQLRARALSQDFGTRALGLADAKAIQASLVEALAIARGSGNPASCAAVLALAGFYRGLGFRRGEGFKGAAEDWQRLVERQEGLLLEAAWGALSERGVPSESYARKAPGFGKPAQNAGKRNRSHWLHCIALACARCELASGSPLAGHEAVLACLREALFEHLLSLSRLHRAVGSFLVPRGSSRAEWNGTGTERNGTEKERSGDAGLVARLPLNSQPEVPGSAEIPFSTVRVDLVAAVDELRERVEGEAFRNVGVLARALCDHCREAGHANRGGVMQEVLCFAQNLGDGHRVYAASAARAYGELERGATAEAAVRKVLDAAFLSVTVFCGTLLPEGAVPAGSVPPTEPERGGLAVYCLEALSRVDFCRVPFAEYGALVTRAVSAASGSREWAEGHARTMPPYEETTEFLWKAATAEGVEDSQRGPRGRVNDAEETRVLGGWSLAASRSGGGETRGETVESAASTSGRSQADVTSERLSQNQAFERGLIHTGPGGLPPEVSRSTSWAVDRVHSARVHFMLRVLAPCVEKLGDDVFAERVIPTLLLFLLHPTAAVSRSAHVLFSAFLESREAFRRNERTEWGGGTERSTYEEWADQDLGPVQAAPKNGLLSKLGFLQRLSFAPPQTDFRTRSPPETSVPERVALFYVERSLIGFPGLTSFEAFTGGVAAIVRHVPPGSPAIVLALRRIASAAKSLYERNVQYVVLEGEKKDAKEGGEPEKSAGGQLTRLLVHLIPVVDIQVLTGLLHETEAVVLSIQDQSAQQAALAELYEVLAANEDYTRKAHCTVWYQHLAEKCVKQFRARLKEGKAGAATAATAKSKSGKGGGRAWSGLWGLARARPNVGGGSADAVT